MKKRPTLEGKDRLSVLLFISGQLTAFFFLTLLQVSPMRLFLPWLIFMHVGIALFILSRRRFLQERKEVIFHFRIVYGLLALYLPLLVFKLVGRFFGAGIEESLIAAAAYGLAGICLVVASWNALKMVRTLKNE